MNVFVKIENILKLRHDYKIILRNIKTNRKSYFYLFKFEVSGIIHDTMLRVGEIYEYVIDNLHTTFDSRLASLVNEKKQFHLVTITDEQEKRILRN